MIKILNASEFKPSRTAQQSGSAEVTETVAEIIADVAKRGDAAVRDYTEKFDGCRLEALEVLPDEIDAACRTVDQRFIEVMERAAKNIEDFHRRQIREGFVMTSCDGVVLGQRIIPVRRAGIHIPAFSAACPSSVLMNCIPAKLAGVEEIIITAPPAKGTVRVNPGILAAAKIGGAHRVFSIGGAQAVAALAYGTDSVPAVDVITGPGNAYVAEAKRQVYGIVGIDMIAGPSDILVIADENADPALVAADMLSQAEHGELSIAILITLCPQHAEKVSIELEAQLAVLPREGEARNSIDNNGMIIIADSIEQAFDISNELAPEHLEIFLDNPFEHLGKVNNAGSVFLGRNTPEALGDYFAGPNHTLPTSGTARFAGPLSVDNFVKKSSFTYYTADAFKAAAPDVIRFAKEEKLDAHALSISKRT